MRAARQRGCATALVNGEAVSKMQVVESNDTGKSDTKGPRTILLLAKWKKTRIDRHLQGEWLLLRELNARYDRLERDSTRCKNRIHKLARYADDFLILVSNRRKAERVMADVVGFVERKLKLMVNAAKSRVDRLSGCVFLGCQIERKQIRWSKTAVAEFRTKVRQLTGRTWGVSIARRLKSLSRYVSGWFGYYRVSRTWGELLELDKWIRRRGRQCYWKKWKRGPTRRRMLLRLEAAREEVHLASRSRKGCWRMSTNSIVQAALTNEWLDQQGVPNLQHLWIAFHYPPTTTTTAAT